MKQLLPLLLLFLTHNSFSQSLAPFTGIEKAYMYHMVMKSPILKENIGRYFEYSGPKIVFKDSSINYDSTEMLIINQPEYLFIRKSELAKSDPGIIAELANKMALWQLNKALLVYTDSNNPELSLYKNDYESFVHFLLQKLPSNALTTDENGQTTFQPKVMNVLNPSLNFDNKTALLSAIHFLDINDQEKTLLAINNSINQWVQNRAASIFAQLGGKTTQFENYLIAAGDGSNTSGMLDEREKDERGRWNRGLPKAVGLFPYQFHIQQMENSQLKEIEPERFATINTQTIGNDRQTNIHADVWGYNDKKQTTVVIEKKSKSYILFGSGETRFLSPDSSFSKGKTFYSIINELQNVWIKNLNEVIYGKNGIQADIDYWKAQTKVAYDEIKVTEVGISSFNIANYNTSNQGIKKRKKNQQKLVEMNERLEYCKQKVSFHEKKKADALTLLASYQKKLTHYKELLGYNWVKWTLEENIYTFEDGATFNLLTQEFRFPPSKSPESFEVRLLAIPFSALSNEADEVMLHLAISDIAPGFDRPIQLTASDLFASNAYELKNNLFETTDSVAVLRAFELILKKPTINIIARGQGIGQWTEGHIEKMTPAIDLPSYPGKTKEEREKSKSDSSYSRLRRSEVFLGFQNKSVTIEVNSYTDPVQSNFEPQNAQLKEWISEGKMNQNDALSVYRSAALLKRLKLELNVKSGQYLSRDLAKIVIDHLNKAIDKARISVGTMSIALSEL